MVWSICYFWGASLFLLPRTFNHPAPDWKPQMTVTEWGLWIHEMEFSHVRLQCLYSSVCFYRKCVCECRVWPVCELWLDDCHRLMNWPWSMLADTVCLWDGLCICTPVCWCKCVCVWTFAMTHNVCFLFFFPPSGKERRWISPVWSSNGGLARRSHRARGPGSDLGNVPDLWRCTIRGG